MSELWEVIAMVELLKESDDSESDKEPAIEDVLVNYAAESGKIFSTLESYALELQANEFETVRTLEIYRLVRGYHFDSLRSEGTAHEQYDTDSHYVQLYQAMITMKEVELECYELLTEACSTTDLNQLTTSITSAEHGQKLALELIDQVHDVTSKLRLDDEKKKKRDGLAYIIVMGFLLLVYILIAIVEGPGFIIDSLPFR